MTWQETRPLVFTSGYSWKEIPPEDGKVLFIFPLLINPFKKIQRDQADEMITIRKTVFVSFGALRCNDKVSFHFLIVEKKLNFGLCFIQ